MPILLATSSASQSAANLTYAFLEPSGRTSVFTFWMSTSYIFFTAARIWGLLAWMSTMKTRVLLSSIFFMADSVVNGNLMMENASNRGAAADDLVGHLGERARRRVDGRLKWTEVRTFFLRRLFLPFNAALADAFAAGILVGPYSDLLDNRNRTQKWDESPC